jgi:hypothetical membrane protein
MNERTYALFGVIGPLMAYVFIGFSIASAPWFSWWNNALSDLGHAVKSEVAQYYNFGLAAAGLLVLIYAATAFRKHARYTSLWLAATAFLVLLVAVFDEVYGFLHTVVSVLLFVTMIVASIVYAIEKKSILGMASFIIGLSSWILYWTGSYSAGIAVPETISATAATSWVVISAFKMYARTPIGNN